MSLRKSPPAYGPWETTTSIEDFMQQTLAKKFASDDSIVDKLPELEVAIAKRALATDMGDLQVAPACQLLLAAKDVFGAVQGPLMMNAVLKHIGTPNNAHSPPATEIQTALALRPEQPAFGQTGAGGEANADNFPDCISAERIHKSALVWPDELKQSLKSAFAPFSTTNKADKAAVQNGLRLVAEYLLKRFGVSPVHSCTPNSYQIPTPFHHT